jgi:hypothetical protein
MVSEETMKGSDILELHEDRRIWVTPNHTEFY